MRPHNRSERRASQVKLPEWSLVTSGFRYGHRIFVNRRSPSESNIEYGYMRESSQGKTTGMEILGYRLEEARKTAGLSQRRLAREIGTASSQISMVENGKAGMSLKMALAAAKALGVSMDYLVGLVSDPRPSRQMLTQLQTSIARMRDLEEERPELDEDWGDYVGISEIDTSAGIGAVVHDEAVTGRMKFPSRWLRQRTLRPGRCRIIRVVGESMDPTLPDGSAILINLDSKHRKDGKIFVIRIGDDLVVKRTVRDREAGWLLVSDNRNKRTWATHPWPEDAQVIGEVKWVGRSLP